MMNYSSEDGSSILNPGGSGLNDENGANNGSPVADMPEGEKGESTVLEKFHEDALQQVKNY
jgi:hypothetical protein